MKKILLLLFGLLCLGVASAEITCNEIVTRSAPGSATGNFQVSYTVSAASGQWGASVLDSVSGGCTFPNGQSSIQIALVSDLPNPLVYTITAPASGTCVFTGDYMFGECTIRNLGQTTVNVGGGGGCTNGQTQSCGSTIGACAAGTQTCSSGQWGSCVGGVGPSAETCDGIDNDCDGQVDEGNVCGSCTNGQTRSCGSTIGACTAGTQTCSSGQWGSCVGGSGPSAETCNSIDDDCDGSTDEGNVCGTTCSPDWSCGAWSNSTGGCGTRTCTDTQNCGVNTNKPDTSKSCTGGEGFFNSCVWEYNDEGDCLTGGVLALIIGGFFMVSFLK